LFLSVGEKTRRSEKEKGEEGEEGGQICHRLKGKVGKKGFGLSSVRGVDLGGGRKPKRDPASSYAGLKKNNWKKRFLFNKRGQNNRIRSPSGA